MAQRTISVRKDMVRAERGSNKAANLRLQAILNKINIIIPLTVADGSTVLSALTFPTALGAIVLCDAWSIKTGSTGGASDAVQLCADSGGSNAISSSLALNGVAAGTKTTTTIISQTYAAIAAGGTLYVKRTHTTDCGCVLFVEAYLA